MAARLVRLAVAAVVLLGGAAAGQQSGYLPNLPGHLSIDGVIDALRQVAQGARAEGPSPFQAPGRQAPSQPIPSTESVEAAFSPDGGAERLVLKVIASARKSARVMAYSYTSSTVTRALIDAKRRGVDVQLVADEGHNAGSQYARAALSALVNAGIPVRLNGVYAIHHDKVIIVDGVTVQTGSFNYSAAGASKNSENALVVWNNPALARRYLTHWQSRFDAGEPYRPRY